MPKFDTSTFTHLKTKLRKANTLRPINCVREPFSPHTTILSLPLSIDSLIKIFTIDNLIKRGFSLVNWWCMCWQSGETVNHLLRNCNAAYALWSEVFKAFQVHLVMPLTVESLLFGWRNWFGRHSSDVWNLVLACIMWIVWKERNRHTFEDVEILLEHLQSLLICTLLSWYRARGFSQYTSIIEFLYSCRPTIWFIVRLFLDTLFSSSLT